MGGMHGWLDDICAIFVIFLNLDPGSGQVWTVRSRYKTSSVGAC